MIHINLDRKDGHWVMRVIDSEQPHVKIEPIVFKKIISHKNVLELVDLLTYTENIALHVNFTEEKGA